jgi:deoxyribodipyrimidine photo-lyase
MISNSIPTPSFPTDLPSIEARLQEIDPVRYHSSRNYADGAVTYLSPYISRGVLSTRQVYDYIKRLELGWGHIEKLVQELAWRDYWQQVWIAKGDAIFDDLKHPQAPVKHHQTPKAVLDATTGIEAVDQAIERFYQTGYMHNHMRMYVAAICCNIGQAHWLNPAKWLYAHLLDGDLASNHLSWQWVAGSNANKKYYANQENINRYFHSTQQGTFLDVPYEAFDEMEVPKILQATDAFDLHTNLPDTPAPVLDPTKITLVYNYYNLDPYWHADEDVQRVLLLEPSFFKAYPVSKHCLDFALALSGNMENITLFCGEFSDLEALTSREKLVFKEHPTNRHYRGTEEPRTWMSSVTGYYPSFFAFWKKCRKEL